MNDHLTQPDPSQVTLDPNSLDVAVQALRADRAEQNLREAEAKLARVLQITDAWDETFGSGMIRADMAASAVRTAIRPAHGR